MLRINPTAAALMLSEYVDLRPGDWVIQNPSNSGVGRAVIAFGKARGLHSSISSAGKRPLPRSRRRVARWYWSMTNVRSIKLQRPSVTEGFALLWTGWVARQPRGWRVPYHSTVNSSDILLWAAMLRRVIFGPS